VDATDYFLRQLYVADLPSRNPDHWPQSPTTLTLADLADSISDVLGSMEGSASSGAAVGSAGLRKGASIILSDGKRQALSSRQLDVLAGWIRYLAQHYPIVGWWTARN
ncbi:hypothetical protein CYMTET_53479, partial [Cymbomonas tetramitiformis]